MSKVAAYYHIVFCTKAREMTLPKEVRDDMYRFMWKEIQNQKCRLIRIGGIANHVHILIDLHPSVALSDLMKQVKGKSSTWMGRAPGFIRFKGWASEYFASTVSPEDRFAVIEYIKNQETHHYGIAFDDEIQCMYQMADLPDHDNDLV
ncbi:MAG: IS200/IS605 family transposase [Muribaculaceae bacterium]|nr:IS200/IS605 family transposase [Muribaculaceae bacterium]